MFVLKNFNGKVKIAGLRVDPANMPIGMERKIKNMSNSEIKKLFIASCYNSRGEYLSERKRDYCAAQFRWSCFIDSLCKSGEITQRAYENATF